MVIPAVDHDGPRVWGITRLDSPQESQEGCRVLGHPVVWPSCKLELADLPFLTGAILEGFAEIAPVTEAIPAPLAL